MKLGYKKLSVNKLTDLEFQCRRHLYNICKIYIFFMYIIILAINCHSLFCLWVVSPLQGQSSILVFILFIYVLYVTNHQSVKCKCLYFCALTGFLIDLIKLFYSILFYNMHSARYRMMTLIRSRKR